MTLQLEAGPTPVEIAQVWHPIISFCFMLLAVATLLVTPTTVKAFPLHANNIKQPGRLAGTNGVLTMSGQLQEVSPPQAIQQLRLRLSEYKPRLTLLAPQDGSVLPLGPWRLRLCIEGWPVYEDPDLGIGAHVVLQVDNNAPIRLARAESGLLDELILPLRPGSHRIAAYAAYPWGEAVKASNAGVQWRLHVLQPLEGTQPEEYAPWLSAVSPNEMTSYGPLLLDWILWNAPIQNLHEGDDRWRLRASIGKETVVLNRQVPLWLQGIPPETTAVQIELLDALGTPITPVFNNWLLPLPPRSAEESIWLQHLDETSIERLLGVAPPENRPSKANSNTNLKSVVTDEEPGSSQDNTS